MDTFILTLQMFTSLPINKEIEVSDKRLIRSVVFWPVVGMIIGMFDTLICFLASRIFSIHIAAAFAILAEMWMTRGFHLDGLADTTDGLFSSRDRARMIEIMDDSHIGTFGVLACILDIGFRYVAIISCASSLCMLMIGPVAGKMVQGIAMHKVKYPKKKGMGKSYIGRVPAAYMITALAYGCLWTVGCLVISSLMSESNLIFMLIRAVLVPVLCCGMTILLRQYIVRKIGGMTGDTMGAVSEIIEIFSMLLLCIRLG